MRSSAESLPSEPVPASASGLIGWVAGHAEGPLLLCIGGLHGNEPAGVQALKPLVEQVRARRHALSGDFVAVVGNSSALAAGRRFISYDLNRAWTPSRVESSRHGLTVHRDPEGGPSATRRRRSTLTPEDAEMVRLLHLLDVVSERRRGPVHVLDLHTTSGWGGTFTSTADRAAHRRFAMAIPVPLVLGLNEHLEGTLLTHLDDLGCTTTVCECGQHEEPRAVNRAGAAVWLALKAAGMLADAAIPELDHSYRIMRAARRDLPKIFEMVHRHPVQPEDRYRTRPGFTNFQPVRAGTVIGDDRTGEIVAPAGGMLLMPLYQELGEDGFFVVRDRGGLRDRDGDHQAARQCVAASP